MTSENRLVGPRDRDEDIDEVFEWGHPNPGRVGCPPREVLIALARRERSSQDAAYEHVANCSPCYREFLAEVEGEQVGSNQDGWARVQRQRWLPVAAALIVAAIVGTWFLLRSPGEERGLQEARLIDVQLDLRPYTIMRGVDEESRHEPLALTRGRLRLTMLLPLGFKPGDYEVQIFDSQKRARARATGHAEIRDRGTALQTTIDLRRLSPGSYQIAVRQGDTEWRLFPAHVE